MANELFSTVQSITEIHATANADYMRTNGILSEYMTTSSLVFLVLFWTNLLPDLSGSGSKSEVFH